MKHDKVALTFWVVADYDDVTDLEGYIKGFAIGGAHAISVTDKDILTKDGERIPLSVECLGVSAHYQTFSTREECVAQAATDIAIEKEAADLSKVVRDVLDAFTGLIP